jgi:hypothetical protein
MGFKKEGDMSKVNLEKLRALIKKKDELFAEISDEVGRAYPTGSRVMFGLEEPIGATVVSAGFIFGIIEVYAKSDATKRVRKLSNYELCDEYKSSKK